MLLRNLAIASTLAVAAPAAVYAATQAPVAVQTVKTSAPVSSSTDSAGYAEREKQDQKAQDFKGGDAVVIGISGGAILVLLLLLLILA